MAGRRRTLPIALAASHAWVNSKRAVRRSRPLQDDCVYEILLIKAKFIWEYIQVPGARHDRTAGGRVGRRNDRVSRGIRPLRGDSLAGRQDTERSDPRASNERRACIHGNSLRRTSDRIAAVQSAPPREAMVGGVRRS